MAISGTDLLEIPIIIYGGFLKWGYPGVQTQGGYAQSAPHLFLYHLDASANAVLAMAQGPSDHNDLRMNGCEHVVLNVLKVI